MNRKKKKENADVDATLYITHDILKEITDHMVVIGVAAPRRALMFSAGCPLSSPMQRHQAAHVARGHNPWLLSDGERTFGLIHGPAELHQHVLRFLVPSRPWQREISVKPQPAVEITNVDFSSSSVKVTFLSINPLRQPHV